MSLTGAVALSSGRLILIGERLHQFADSVDVTFDSVEIASACVAGGPSNGDFTVAGTLDGTYTLPLTGCVQYFGGFSGTGLQPTTYTSRDGTCVGSPNAGFDGVQISLLLVSSGTCRIVANASTSGAGTFALPTLIRLFTGSFDPCSVTRPIVITNDETAFGITGSASQYGIGGKNGTVSFCV